MKKFLSLLLVLGFVVLFSKIASASHVYTPYTAEAVVGGVFSLTPSLVLASNVGTTTDTIRWSSSDTANAFQAVTTGGNWKTALAAIKLDVTNQKAGTTVQLYQDNANAINGVYISTFGKVNEGNVKVFSGLIRANSNGGDQRFPLAYKIAASTTPVAPVDGNETGGFYMKDKSDDQFGVNYAGYYTILSDQGYLTYVASGNGTSTPIVGGYAPFTSGIIYVSIGASFQGALPGTYGTKSITLEGFNE